MECPNCAFKSPPEMIYCGRCGTRLKKTCPECSFENPLDFRFCGSCGLPLPVLTAHRKAAEPAPLPGIAQQITIEKDTRALVTPALPKEQPAPLEGERRQATVILADVFQSTVLLEHIGTEAWVAVMNDVLQIMEAEIYRFGGEVNQFRGDGLVAFFGATAAHEDDPERAVLSALSMQSSLGAYAATLLEKRAIDVRVRVGVNTGEVIVTSIGESHQHRENTAMGEAVSVAARLETAAEPNTILVSESTYRRCESQFEWQTLTPLQVKGMAQPLPVYRPLAPQRDTKADRSRRLQAYGFSVPLIGRENELNDLKLSVDNLANGRGGIVQLVGDEGIGKSRLESELRRYVFRDALLLAETQGREPDLQTSALLSMIWLRGQCRSYEQSWPYAMWHNLLRRWLGVGDGEPVPEISRRLYDQSLALWGDQLVDYYPYLAAFLSLPLPDPYADRVKHLDAKELRRQSYLAVRSWLEALSSRAPLVIAFNNAHWADASSLNLLEYCLPLCDHLPLLWLIIIRPLPDSNVWALGQRAMSEYPHRYKYIALEPLSEEQIGEMIDRLIGPNILSAELREPIIRRAEGNPYYVEELIRSLIEQGILIQDAQTGQWQATRAVVPLDLPDTLQSLLLGRLDSLTPAERRVLQIAAVIGDIFWSNLLANLVGSPSDLKQHLISMQRVRLIVEHGRVHDLGMEYAFQSRMVRQVIYESILSKQRAAYHLQIAEYLEQHFNKDAPAKYYSMLAYHYWQAGERSKELLYIMLAASEAKAAYANTEALGFFSRVLAILDELEAETSDKEHLYAIRSQKFGALNEQRELFFIIGEFQKGREAAKALLPLARQLHDDPIWLIDALLQQPGVATWISREELQAGRILAEEAIDLARRSGDKYRVMQCLVALARQGIELNDPTALDDAEQALTLARELDQPYTEAQILITMSSVYSWSDEPERGRDYLETAILVCQGLDDKVAEIRLLHQISLQFERSGDYYRVLTDYQQQRLQLSREINHRAFEADALMVCGQIQGIYLGDYEGGLALEKEAWQIWQDSPGEAWILIRIVQILTAQENYDEAFAVLEQIRQIHFQELNEFFQVGLHLATASLEYAVGDEPHLRRALANAEQAQHWVANTPRLGQQHKMAAATKAAVIHLALADASTHESEIKKHRQQALDSSMVALTTFEHFGYAQALECVSEEVFFNHSQVLAAAGRRETSLAFLQRAYDEMMRKHALIPEGSPFRQSYLENIHLHRQIEAAFVARSSQSKSPA